MFAILLILVSMLESFSSVSSEISHPDCSPCHCKFQQPKILITCRNSTLSLEEFKNKIWDFDSLFTFEEMSDFAFHILPAKKRLLTLEMTVKNSVVSNMDLNGYSNMRKLILTNIHPLIGDTLLSNIPGSLKTLNATNASLSHLDTTSMVSNLTVLDLTNNNFEEIITQPSLKYLSMQSNRIRSFKTNNCSLMTNLSYLDLSRNMLEELPEDAFNCILLRDNNLDVYLTLLLSWNKIESIHQDVFKGLKILKVDLSHNMLRSIDSNQLNWRKLQYANLQFNPWRCDCKAQWILDDLVPLMYGTQQGLLHEFRCATPKKWENRPLVYWLNHSVDVFCGSATSMYLTSPGGGEFEIQKVTFIVSIVFCVINVLLTIALIIICCRNRRMRGSYQKLAVGAKARNGGTPSDKRSLIDNKA